MCIVTISQGFLLIHYPLLPRCKKQSHVKRGTMSDYEMKEVRAAEYAGCDIIFCRKQNPVFMKKERLNSPETHILLPSFLPALRNEDEEL